MQSHQHLIGLGLGLDSSAGSGYSYALKQPQIMLPMLGGSSSLTDSKLLGMGISPYLTPPHSSIELDLGLSPDLNSSDTNTIHPSPSASPPSNSTITPPTSLQQQIAISTAFYPGSSIFGRQFGSLHPDLVVQSGDGVFFYVHLALILAKSQNGFGGLLPAAGSLVGAGAAQAGEQAGASGYLDTPLLTPDSSEPTPPASPRSATGNARRGRTSTSSSSSSSSSSSLSNSASLATPLLPASDPALPTLISLPEASGVINILFHILYNTTSFARYSPDFETLSAVLPFMRKYGFDVAETLGGAGGSSNSNNGTGIASSEVMQTLLSFARERPLDVYTLAAQYGLRELAVAASPYTLDVSLSNLTDQQSVAMGPLYLKWLFFLHLGRSEALKRILVKPFEPHPAGLHGSTCTEEDRSAMGRAWGLVTAYILSLPSTQNMSVGSLSSTYGSLMGSVKCQRCKEQLGRTIEEIVRGWGGVQNTI